MLTRDDLIRTLYAWLEPLELARAAWLGGSDATGRADALSDVDLMLVVRAGRIEEGARAIHAALEAVSPIRVHYRMPWPTWHGFHQAFYQLADAPEHLMVDWVILEAGQPHPWLEVERHGVPRVLFDKDGLVKSVHVDRAAIDAAVAKKVAELRQRFALFRHLPAKLIERGVPADAMHFYMTLVLRPLVDVLRCVHCPERHDYGFRYVRSDLPRAKWEMLERLSYVPGPGVLPGRVTEAREAFDAALAEWDARKKSPSRE